MNQPATVFLDSANWLEIAPTVWRPQSQNERLAAILGYLTGDGTIKSRQPQYRRKNGEISRYKARMTGALYSNERNDLILIQQDLMSLGLIQSASVTEKKTKLGYDSGYQIQIGGSACEWLLMSGAPHGKKTAQEFDTPEWIMTGDKSTKRSYIAALFGAEGTFPTKDKNSKGRMPRRPSINMCKRGQNDGVAYFLQLQSLLEDLGISSTLTQHTSQKFGAAYTTNWLSINSTGDNLIRFFDEVGYVYCDRKSIEGWKWSQYLKAYQKAAHDRRETVINGRQEGATFAKIGETLGISRGAVKRMHDDIAAGKGTTAGHNFPHCVEWMSERWLDDLTLLKVKVSSTKSLSPRPVWNMLVSSPDHSYLLASGINNFNSFETMSGRVYYPFDRNIHVGTYNFNPDLPIWIGQDFNIDPMSSAILQPQPNGEVWVVDEVYRYNSNTSDVCDELERRYWRHMDESRKICVYPDPAGNNRSHGRGESDLDIFRERGFKSIKFRKKHPRVADRVNAVNRMLVDANGRVRLKIDERCRNLIESFEQVLYKEGGSDIDKRPSVEHITDALGYPIELEYPLRKIQIMGKSI